jgi:hypothetical protein
MIISLLFTRHHFINFQSCVFILINPSMKFKNVIKRIQNFEKLVSFSIYESNHNILNENDEYHLTQTILMHKSSSLRSIVLQYPYNYSDISAYTSIPSTLISLTIHFSGSSLTVSFNKILSIFRLCHTIRYY